MIGHVVIEILSYLGIVTIRLVITKKDRRIIIYIKSATYTQ